MPLDDPGADERGRGNPLTEGGRVPAQRRGGLPAVRRPPQARGQAQVGSAETCSTVPAESCLWSVQHCRDIGPEVERQRDGVVVPPPTCGEEVLHDEGALGGRQPYDALVADGAARTGSGTRRGRRPRPGRPARWSRRAAPSSRRGASTGTVLPTPTGRDRRCRPCCAPASSGSSAATRARRGSSRSPGRPGCRPRRAGPRARGRRRGRAPRSTGSRAVRRRTGTRSPAPRLPASAAAPARHRGRSCGRTWVAPRSPADGRRAPRAASRAGSTSSRATSRDARPSRRRPRAARPTGRRHRPATRARPSSPSPCRGHGLARRARAAAASRLDGDESPHVLAQVVPGSLRLGRPRPGPAR